MNNQGLEGSLLKAGQTDGTQLLPRSSIAQVAKAKNAALGAETRPRGVLIIVENSTVPQDRRVWQEAKTLRSAGYDVSVICPTNANATKGYEILEGVHIYRHPLPAGSGICSYLVEYVTALFAQAWLALKIKMTRGFDVIHACNPPDTIFFDSFNLSSVYSAQNLYLTIMTLSPELYRSEIRDKSILLPA